MPETGYYMVWYLTSGIFITIGAALMYTVRADTSPAKIYGFSILLGLGMTTTQAGYAVGPTTVSPDRVSEVIQFMNISQGQSQLLGLTIASAIFQSLTYSGLKIVLAGTGFSDMEIQAAIAGVRSTVLQQASPALKAKRIDVIVRSIDDAYAMSIAAKAFPIVPRHEIIGHVAAVADGETEWEVGDRVGGAWHGSHDGTCDACRKGLFQMCDNELINGITKNGGYAEYTILHTSAAVHVPAHVDAAAYAPLLCAGITVFNSIRRMQVPAGSTVAVQGIGGLGHLAIQYANRFGYRVVALSRDADKEKFARELGAHKYIDASRGDQGEALQRLGGASLIMATAPSAKAIAPLMKGLGMLGKLLILTIAGDVPVNTELMTQYGLSVQAWPSGHAEEAIEFAELQDINCMIEKFPLERCNDALNAMVKGTVRFRAVITME